MSELPMTAEEARRVKSRWFETRKEGDPVPPRVQQAIDMLQPVGALPAYLVVQANGPEPAAHRAIRTSAAVPDGKHGPLRKEPPANEPPTAEPRQESPVADDVDRQAAIVPDSEGSMPAKRKESKYANMTVEDMRRRLEEIKVAKKTASPRQRKELQGEYHRLYQALQYRGAGTGAVPAPAPTIEPPEAALPPAPNSDTCAAPATVPPPETLPAAPVRPAITVKPLGFEYGVTLPTFSVTAAGPEEAREKILRLVDELVKKSLFPEGGEA